MLDFAPLRSCGSLVKDHDRVEKSTFHLCFGYMMSATPDVCAYHTWVCSRPYLCLLTRV